MTSLKNYDLFFVFCPARQCTGQQRPPVSQPDRGRFVTARSDPGSGSALEQSSCRIQLFLEALRGADSRED